MRVNIEDSVKRHLPRLMREMGWSNREVIGALACVWQSTQDAEIYDAPASRIHTVCAIDFDTDEQCEKFIAAMIGAQLITVLENGDLRIRGNKQHVERLQNLRSRAKSGGMARQEQKLNDFVAVSEPSQSRDRAISEPSLLLTPNSLKDLNQKGGGVLTRAREDETPVGARASIVPAPVGLEIFSWWQDEHSRVRGGSKALVPPPAAIGWGRTVYVLAGESLDEAKRVITNFVEADHGYWRERNWALYLLTDPRDFERARLQTQTAINPDDPWGINSFGEQS